MSSALRAILAITPRALLTPSVVAVGILSHVAVDAGYVLVIPLGGIIFYAAGRHPLAGIAAAFAGVSGGFSATLFLPLRCGAKPSRFSMASVRALAVLRRLHLPVELRNSGASAAAHSFVGPAGES